MSLRLKSGRFESTIQIPLTATDDERKGFIDSWLSLMAAGVKCGSTHRKQREDESGQ